MRLCYPWPARGCASYRCPKIVPDDLYSDRPWSPPRGPFDLRFAMFECSELLPAIPSSNPLSTRVLNPSLGQKQKRPSLGGPFCFWRRGRDSNPRRDVMPSTDFESVPL